MSHSLVSITSGFTDCFPLSIVELGIIQGRAYFHQAGRSLFETTVDPVGEARLYLSQVIRRYEELLRTFQLGFAAVWGDKEKNKRAVDFFGFSGISNWQKSNPDISVLVFKEEKLAPRASTCGDAAIMLGVEESYRRTTRNLEQYLRKPPVIDGVWYHK